MIPFTFKGYADLIDTLRKSGYEFADYHDYADFTRCVILRHDIDNSIEKALTIAELEHEQGVKSTYFTLLRTDFYNPASRKGLSGLKKIQSLGHEIGLHFDEMAYDELDDVEVAIKHEAGVLSDIIGTPITIVSMHRPSQKTLDANYDLYPMVNSYGKTFFNDFKYLSDSRRRWREPAHDIIKSGEYDRLHILTHPIWYQETEESIHDTIKRFVTSANKERYLQESENIKDIESILDINEI
ncbi:MAG: hypothetical protein IKZ61_00795 [Prevotella sp.]|nr:hypothetical protein [Prevotella sp.]